MEIGTPYIYEIISIIFNKNVLLIFVFKNNGLLFKFVTTVGYCLLQYNTTFRIHLKHHLIIRGHKNQRFVWSMVPENFITINFPLLYVITCGGWHLCISCGFNGEVRAGIVILHFVNI